MTEKNLLSTFREKDQDNAKPSYKTISRRDFIENVWKISSLGMIAPILAGCASGGLPLVMAREQDDYLKIALAEAPELAWLGGAVALASVEQVELNVIIFHLGENEYIALSPVCTHLGCRVRKARDGFDCPCHGSRYDSRGQVVNGPAARNLTRFPVHREGDELLVDLRTQ